VLEALIRTRTKYISLIGALAGREGCRIGAGPSPSFAHRVEEAGLPAHTPAQIEPLLAMLKAAVLQHSLLRYNLPSSSVITLRESSS
jgi:hypothetical protein